MKILLINPPGWQKGSINLGLSYLAAGLLKAGHEVKIFDVNESELLPEAVAERAAVFAPAVIGFSIKTATVKPALLLSAAIKKVYKNALHIAGGPHISLDYENFLQENPEIAYAFLGEADLSLVEFINKLSKKEELSVVPGLAFRNASGITANAPKIVELLDELPFPEYEVIDTFTPAGFRYPLITSRGCPYNCTYCCVGVVSTKKWRSRSVAGIMNELATAKQNYNITQFEVLDDNFTLKLDRAKDLCRELIAGKMRLEWYCHNGIRADKLDPELAKLMKKAGCTSVALGIESGNERVFDSIKKGEKLSDIVKAVKLIKKAGMRAVGYFIIGLPGDTLAGIKSTIAFQRSLELDNYVYGILTPYPRTEVWELVKKEGTILLDIKDTYHFSAEVNPPLEYPYFKAARIREAYYLATYYGLYLFKENFTRKYGKAPGRILYINFSAETGFTATVNTVFDGVQADVFTSKYKAGLYLPNGQKAGINNLYVFEGKETGLAKVAAFVKFASLLARQKYDAVFYNSATKRLFLPAVLLVIRPKAFFLEEEKGKYVFGFFSKKVLKYVLSRFNFKKLVFAAVSLLLYPVFRLGALLLAGLLLLKRSEKRFPSREAEEGKK